MTLTQRCVAGQCYAATHGPRCVLLGAIVLTDTPQRTSTMHKKFDCVDVNVGVGVGLGLGVDIDLSMGVGTG